MARGCRKQPTVILLFRGGDVLCSLFKPQLRGFFIGETMSELTLKITCDFEEFLSSIKLLERSLKSINTRFEFFDSFLEFIGFEFNVCSTTATGNCHVSLDVSDSFRDFVRTLRAGDV